LFYTILKNQIMTNFNLDQAEVVELKAIEMTEVDGGYSWTEFKQDVSDFFSGIGEGFSNPRK